MRYFYLNHELDAHQEYLLQCRHLIESANLAHKRIQLDREFPPA